MNRSAFSFMSGLGLLFGLIVILEATHAGPPMIEAGPAAARPAMMKVAKRQDGRTASWVAIALARPLFSHRRRPPSTTVAAVGGPRALPRLTGILLSPGRRLAIFAPAHGKPIITGQGGRIGPYTVRRIAPDRVTLLGADGRHVLRPQFGGVTAAPVAMAHQAPPTLFAGLAAEAKTSHSIVFDQGKPDLPSAATWSGPPGLTALPRAPKQAASAPLLHPAPSGTGH